MMCVHEGVRLIQTLQRLPKYVKDTLRDHQQSRALRPRALVTAVGSSTK